MKLGRFIKSFLINQVMVLYNDLVPCLFLGCEGALFIRKANIYKKNSS